MGALLAHFEGRYDELHALIARDTHGSGIAMAAEAIASAMVQGAGAEPSRSTQQLKSFISAQQRRTPPPTPTPTPHTRQ